MAEKFYITTPLYYINASPHIGHSYTTIAADCLARRMRAALGDKKVWLLTGTDEHGQKIERAAREAGLAPREFSDRMVVKFKELWKKLDVSYDDFIRTTEERHIRTVQKVLEILYRKGDIYEAQYQGWYCTPCETFWTQAQLGDESCPDCKRPLEKISEKNYFFKLSQYQDWLSDYIRSHQDFIRPDNRRQEILSFLKLNRLSDLCISRPKERLGWGIPLPFSAGHVTYVWFDALINYISAVGEFDAQGSYKSKWWPADLHLIGKDILRQHAVYWPIILRALGLELPGTVFAHGWWMVGENKMSKSRGNVVSPLEMADKFGIDVYRYFLLRDIPFGADGNFSEEAVIKRFNSDLANDLGNLVYRTLTMVEKYFAGTVPAKGEAASPQARAIRGKIESLDSEIERALGLSRLDFALALEKTWELINLANKYVEETKPWNLAKEDKATELAGFIRILAEVIRKAGTAVYPFMPHTAGLIKEQLGKDQIKKGKPLFPRIES